MRDMVALEDKHPDVFAEFMAGNFTVKKTTHAFAALAIDQVHEQNNASVKGDGGAVGLTENPAALRRWMVSGPEMARVIAEFKATADSRTKKTDLRHHEQTKHTQLAFARDVKSLSGVMREMGNPFCDDSSDLLVLDSRDLADPAVINTDRDAGAGAVPQYANERLVNHHQPNQEKLTFLSSADLQSGRNQEPSFRCRRSRMTAPYSPCCSLHHKCAMEISTTSLLMRTRHVRLPCHRWAK